MEYKCYPSYRDTDSKWLPSVPEHWRYVRLGQYFLERNEKVSDTDYPSLSVTMGGIVPQLETAAKTDAGDNRKKVCQGDFVINSRSDRKGSSGLSMLEGSVSLISIVLKPEGIDGAYVHHLLRSQWFQEEFYRFGKGIVDDLWSTKYSDMKSINIPVPSRDEQQTIASFLDRETARIDALVGKKQRLIELLKEKRQAVITQAVTKGLDPTVPMKDSGVEWLGEVPEHWSVAKLRWLAILQGGIAKGKDVVGKDSVTMPYLRVANVQDGYVDLTEVKEIDVLKSDVKRYLLRQQDVLMNEGGDNDKLGRGTVWNGDIDPCIHQNHVFSIRTEQRLLPEWLALYTRSHSAKAHFFLRSKQSTNLASISASNIMDTSVPVPPLAEQRAILSYVDTTIERFDRLEVITIRSIELLKEHRSALITAAVTGQIDLRDAA